MSALPQDNQGGTFQNPDFNIHLDVLYPFEGAKLEVWDQKQLKEEGRFKNEVVLRLPKTRRSKKFHGKRT